MTPLSPATSTWSISESFSWENSQADLLSGLDISSLLNTNGSITAPLSEADGFFSEVNTHSTRALDSFEDILYNSQRQGDVAMENTQDGNHEPQGSSLSDPLHDCPSMRTSTEVCDFQISTYTAFSHSFELLDLNLELDHQQSTMKTLHTRHATRILDFSQANLYGLLDLIHHGVPESTSTRVTNFMQTLEQKLCGPIKAAVDQQEFSTTTWYLDNEAMIPQWCDGELMPRFKSKTFELIHLGEVFVDEYPYVWFMFYSSLGVKLIN